MKEAMVSVNKCPKCGYCPTCGRSNSPWPYAAPWPYFIPTYWYNASPVFPTVTQGTTPSYG